MHRGVTGRAFAAKGLGAAREPVARGGPNRATVAF
jgi:hypothetical protein